MAEIDRSEIKQLVRDLRAEATNYNRQWLSWLGLASGGGAVALLSFAANLPNPDFALRALLLPLTAFAGGVCFAGLAVLSAAQRTKFSEVHHGAAFTRDELADAVNATPVMFSAPQSIADEQNKPRDKLVTMHDEQHELVEVAWTSQMRWSRAHFVFIAMSTGCFVVGLVSPLVFIALGGHFSPN
jgi:hypothetical protein